MGVQILFKIHGAGGADLRMGDLGGHLLHWQGPRGFQAQVARRMMV